MRKRVLGVLVVVLGMMLMCPLAMMTRKQIGDPRAPDVIGAFNPLNNHGVNDGIYGAFLDVVALIGVIAVPMLAGLFGVWLIRFGWRLTARSAEEALAKDARPPVLFLRSFNDDEAVFLKTRKGIYQWSERYSVEEVIADSLGEIGPVVAIGRPGELAPPLGAARHYVPKAWQAEVIDLIEKSQFVLVMLSNTGGLRWELVQLIKLGALHKTILVLPPVKKNQLPSRWKAFYSDGRDNGISLPESLPTDAVYVTFDRSLTCTVHEARGVRTSWVFGSDRVHYVEPLGIIIHALRRGEKPTVPKKGSRAGDLAIVVSLFVLAALLGVLCSAASGPLGLRSKVSRSNFEKITDGMSQAQVEEILGKGQEKAGLVVPVFNPNPGQPVQDWNKPLPCDKGYVWTHRDRGRSTTITIGFVKDRVAMRDFIGD